MNLAVIIPAYNESESIGGVIDAVCAVVPAAKVIVISDGSADNTAAVASEHGATVLDLPCSLGVGGAVTAGSDPDAEWEEVRTKSRGVLGALRSEVPAG